jgi:uncharacterized protein (TIGR03382 family)
MQFLIRASALAVASLGVVQAADAAFVVSGAFRETTVLNGATVPQSFTTNAASGSFNGDASDLGDAFTTVANQGSNLLSSRMTFVGGVTVTQSGGFDLSGRSNATVTFGVSVNETIRWSMNLNAAEFGGGTNAGSVSVRLEDVTGGTTLINQSRSFVGQGNVSLIAGRSYRLIISSTAQANSAGDAESTFNVGFYTIPAPGALALLGLAGVAGRRRR